MTINKNTSSRLPSQDQARQQYQIPIPSSTVLSNQRFHETPLQWMMMIQLTRVE
jgi:hypothetical protein